MIDTALQRLVENEARKKRVHSVVAGLWTSDGQTITAAAGHADSRGTEAMTPETPYFLASVTKMYTAVVVLALVDRGRIDLDAPISVYLHSEQIHGVHVIDGVDHSARITVAQLLDHTSGLADYFEGAPAGKASLADDLQHGRDRSLSLEDIVGITRRLSPEFSPGDDQGKRAHYSDTNYALLGAIVESASGMALADLFTEVVFAPLGLTNTYVFDHESDEPGPAAIYFKDRPIEVPLAMSSFGPDGGLVSTVEESLRFTEAVFNGQLVSTDQLAYMTRRWNRIFFPLRYGSGLMLFKPSRWMSPFSIPPELVGHSGSTGSFAFHDGRRKVFLAGTVNQMDQPGRPFRLMSRMLGLVD